MGDCVNGVFIATLPKAILLALTLRVRTYALNSSANVLETLPAAAASVTACVVVTGDTLSVKTAPVALAGTVTNEGSVTAGLVLDNATFKPPAGAAELNVTVQVSVSVPVMEPVPQDNLLTVGPAPIPLNATTTAVLLKELLTIAI